MVQFIFPAQRVVPSLQELSSKRLAHNIQEDLYTHIPHAKPIKKSLDEKLLIDGDFSKGDHIAEQVQFIDTKIQEFRLSDRIRDLVVKNICSYLPHIIDKAGRYVALHYHNELNGSNIDAIDRSRMEPAERFKITNECLRVEIARLARYNFVLHYGYDQQRFKNQYRYDFYIDNIAAKQMYCKYFKSSIGDTYLNHGTTVKVLFFGGEGRESLPQAAVYLRHVLIKVALEKTTNICMLENLSMSHAVKQVIDDAQLYQQECVAARNAQRDGLLWSKSLLDQAIAREKYNLMWYKEILRYGALCAWLAWVGYYCDDAD